MMIVLTDTEKVFEKYQKKLKLKLKKPSKNQKCSFKIKTHSDLERERDFYLNKKHQQKPYILHHT